MKIIRDLLILLINIWTTAAVAAETSFVDQNLHDRRLQVDRYTGYKTNATLEEVNPLLVLTQINFPSAIKTVREAIDHALQRSGYRVDWQQSAEAYNIFSKLDIPLVHRKLNLMTLKDAIATLAGEAWQLLVDSVNRKLVIRLHAYVPWQIADKSNSDGTYRSHPEESVSLVPQTEPNRYPSDNSMSAQTEPNRYPLDNSMSAQTEPNRYPSDNSMSAQTDPNRYPSDISVSAQTEPNRYPSDNSVSARTDPNRYPSDNSMSARTEPNLYPPDNSVSAQTEPNRYPPNNSMSARTEPNPYPLDNSVSAQTEPNRYPPDISMSARTEPNPYPPDISASAQTEPKHFQHEYSALPVERSKPDTNVAYGDVSENAVIHEEPLADPMHFKEKKTGASIPDNTNLYNETSDEFRNQYGGENIKAYHPTKMSYPNDADSNNKISNMNHVQHTPEHNTLPPADLPKPNQQIPPAEHDADFRDLWSVQSVIKAKEGVGSLDEPVIVHYSSISVKALIEILVPRGWVVHYEVSDAILKQKLVSHAESSRRNALSSLFKELNLKALFYPGQAVVLVTEKEPRSFDYSDSLKFKAMDSRDPDTSSDTFSDNPAATKPQPEVDTILRNAKIIKNLMRQMEPNSK